MNEMKWISVDDEMPKEDNHGGSKAVIVWDSGNWYRAFYSYTYSEWIALDGPSPEDITHFAYVTAP